MQTAPEKRWSEQFNPCGVFAEESTHGEAENCCKKRQAAASTTAILCKTQGVAALIGGIAGRPRLPLENFDRWEEIDWIPADFGRISAKVD